MSSETIALLDGMGHTLAPSPVAETRFIAGLDLGQSSDYSALAILKETRAPIEISQDIRLDVVHLNRYPLGTPYPEIIDDVCRIMGDNRMRTTHAGPTLVIDATGVGRPCVDMFRRAKPAAKIKAVTITSGLTATQPSAGSYHVPKKDIAGAIQAGLSSGRLKIVPSLALAGILQKELLNFKVKVTDKGNETFAAWRENEHDDLVLAVGIAAWSCPMRRVGQLS